MTDSEVEMYTLKMINSGKWRAVRHPRRRRKLLNRGEGIVWSVVMNAWVWDWEFRQKRGDS
jgi:hypothetical protein